MTWVYCLAKKSHDFVKFKAWKSKVEKETGKSLKAFWTNRGGEFTSDEFVVNQVILAPLLGMWPPIGASLNPV